MANTQKKDIVSDITNTLQDGANFALIRFDKVTHKALEDLRTQLREKNAKINVIKNTLFEKAINKLSETEKELADVREKQFPLKERSALVTFSGDWADGLKTYFKTVKGNEAFGFKFGRIDNTVYGDTDLTKLAELPSRPELMAKLIGTMKSPIARTTRALTFNMQKFVYILNEKAKA